MGPKNTKNYKERFSKTNADIKTFAGMWRQWTPATAQSLLKNHWRTTSIPLEGRQKLYCKRKKSSWFSYHLLKNPYIWQWKHPSDQLIVTRDILWLETQLEGGQRYRYRSTVSHPESGRSYSQVDGTRIPASPRRNIRWYTQTRNILEQHKMISTHNDMRNTCRYTV